MSTQTSTIAAPHPTLVDQSEIPFTDGAQIAVVRLTKWLDWVTQKDTRMFVALPIVQRGSVWRANAIADLWDSLLRGMPVGSFTVSRFDTDKQEAIRVMGEVRSQKQMVPKGSLSLLDGQQRTLAMCIGWEKGMDRRVWVDFGQPGIRGQRFRLRVTTKNQPFGFDPHDHTKKLSRHERRIARERFDTESEHATQYQGKQDYQLSLDHTKPYGAKHPLELRTLIQDWQILGYDIGQWVETTLKRCAISDASQRTAIETRIYDFAEALQDLFQFEIALTRVNPKLVEDAADADDNAQPALVVLFERIANGGTRLSNADYIFSLIKHRFPDAHNLVQELHELGTVSSLLSANDVVMTAVRLAANTNRDESGTLFPDNPTPNPKEFGRLLRSKLEGGGDFLRTALTPLISTDSTYSLLRAFNETHQLLLFNRTSNVADAGLPELALPLLQRQLVQVLVFWVHLQQRHVASADLRRQRFDASRPEILRFVLFWLLCVESKEKEAASKAAFTLLRDEEAGLFPGKTLYENLCARKLAVRLQHPSTVGRFAISSSRPGQKIRAWSTRFAIAKTDSVGERHALLLYSRWFHRKEMLLWLQRITLVKEFPDANPLAGREEDTPYDYDHICPYNDWGRAGYSVRAAFRGYCENGEQGTVGNSIGNYRAWNSSSNRKDQDDSALSKLGLTHMDSVETQEILSKSAISQDEGELWKACSVDKGVQGQWTEERALAFEKIVELRAFRLYNQYFSDGAFSEWVPV